MIDFPTDVAPSDVVSTKPSWHGPSLSQMPRGRRPHHHDNLALAKRKSEGLGSSSGRSRCLPVLQRFASEDAERVAGNKMALDTERIVDGGLNGQEALRADPGDLKRCIFRSR